MKPPRLLIALSGLFALSSAAPPTPRLLGIEHLPTAVRDLDSASARFVRLGFTLKPGRAHDNGIRNVHAKFADGSYIELISAPAAVDPLTSAYRRHLDAGEGPAFVSLYVSRIAGLAELMAPLGGAAEGDSVTFARGALTPFFFGTRAPSPSDRPAFFRHANGAQSLSRVWIATDDRADIEAMAARLGARFHPTIQCLIRCLPIRRTKLPQGELILMPADAQNVRGHPIVGATVRVRDIAIARALLKANGLPFGADGIRDRGTSLIVPPALANGLWLEFSAH